MGFRRRWGCSHWSVAWLIWNVGHHFRIRLWLRPWIRLYLCNIPSFGSSPWFMEELRQLKWEKRNVECYWHSTGDEPDQIRVKALQGLLQGLPFGGKHQYFPKFILSSHLAALFHVTLPSWVEGAQRTPCKGVQKNLFSICQSYWYSLKVGCWPCCRSRGDAWSVLPGYLESVWTYWACQSV